jgi:uncharacterized protein (TIGR02594 family)
MRRSAFAFLSIFVISTVALSVSILSASATNKPNKAVVEPRPSTGLTLQSASPAHKPKKAAIVKSSSANLNLQSASAPHKPKKAAVEKSSSANLNLQSASAPPKPKKAAAEKSSSANLDVQSTSAANKPKKAAVESNSSNLVNEARRWIGTNPTGWSHVWCARFMNFVLKRAGYEGSGSDAASSFASYGRRVWWPQVGSIAVMTRGKNGGHVGVVAGVAEDGKIIVISGNHNKRVGEGRYPRERIYAYVMPN